jgi:hypothetical protein
MYNFRCQFGTTSDLPIELLQQFTRGASHIAFTKQLKVITPVVDSYSEAFFNLLQVCV